MKITCNKCGDVLKEKSATDEGTSCKCGAITMFASEDGTFLAGDVEHALADDDREFVKAGDGETTMLSAKCACGRGFLMRQVTSGEGEFAILNWCSLTIKCPDCGAITIVEEGVYASKIVPAIAKEDA